MRSVGVYNSGGAVRSRLQEQMRRLFNSYVQLVYEHEHGEVSVNSLVADRTEFWWNPKRPDDRTLWESKIELGEKFFEEVIRHPVPLDLNILKTMKRSSLGLGSLHVAHLPDVHAQGSAAALLAATVPPVRIEPGPGKQYEHRERLSYEVPSGVDEN